MKDHVSSPLLRERPAAVPEGAPGGVPRLPAVGGALAPEAARERRRYIWNAYAVFAKNCRLVRRSVPPSSRALASPYPRKRTVCQFSL